jgi:hypothetical protein
MKELKEELAPLAHQYGGWFMFMTKAFYEIVMTILCAVLAINIAKNAVIGLLLFAVLEPLALLVSAGITFVWHIMIDQTENLVNNASKSEEESEE